jgi:hypothetical protein
MEWKDKEALQKCRARLCEDLKLIKVLAEFEADDVITDTDR